MRGRRRLCSLLAIVGCLVLVLCYCCYSDYFQWLFYEVLKADMPCFADDSERDNIRHMIHSWESVMTELNLVHWIDFGSLLGSWRYANVIPWDHDGDVAYLWRDARVISDVVSPKLSRDFGIRLDPELPVQMHYKGTWVDVFAYATYNELRLDLPASKSNDTLTRATFRNPQEFEERYCDIDVDYVIPTTLCRLGSRWVACPHDVLTVLKTRYPFTFSTGISVPFKFQCYAKPWNLLFVFQY